MQPTGCGLGIVLGLDAGIYEVALVTDRAERKHPSLLQIEAQDHITGS